QGLAELARVDCAGRRLHLAHSHSPVRTPGAAILRRWALRGRSASVYGMEGAEQGPPQMPVDAILAEDSVAAGVAAMEQIHGRHLADMNADEQAQAREHWRRQVEEVIAAVRTVHAGLASAGA